MLQVVLCTQLELQPMNSVVSKFMLLAQKRTSPNIYTIFFLKKPYFLQRTMQI